MSYEEKRDKALQTAYSFQTEGPFEFEIDEQFFIFYEVQMEFARTHCHSKEETRILTFGNNRVYNITVRKWEKQSRISEGWELCVVECGVEVGDSVKFEVWKANPSVWYGY